MSPVRVMPDNPHDFTQAELDDLRKYLREQVPDVEVVVDFVEEHGYGVTLYEVIQVVADVRGAGGDYVLAVAYWMQRRWRRDKKRGNPRPRSIVVLDADGNKLRTIDIDEPDGELREDDD